MRYLLISLLWLISAHLVGQNYPMTSMNNNRTITTCTGNFTDDNLGGSGGLYSHSLNRTMTFCPPSADSHIRFTFSQFVLEGANFDELQVYYGNSAVGTPAFVYTGTRATPFVVTSPVPGGCITFRFVTDSSVNYAGFAAAISCVPGCSAPVAVFSDNSDVNLCPSTAATRTVSVDASSSYSTDSYPITQYQWNWGDGTTSVTTTPVTSHTYPNDPGIYTVSLRVKTNNFSVSPSGCISNNENSKQINLLPPPDFTGTTAGPITAVCGGTVDLTGIAASQTITALPPEGTGSTTVLPDELNTFFESAIDMSGYFPPNTTVTASCLPRITFNIEHSFVGDIRIFLIAPSGQTVTLLDGYGGGPGAANNLGGTKLGYCVNGADNGVAGCPAPYHIVNTGGYNWQNVNSRHTVTQSCPGYTGTCESGNYFRQDQNFNSSQPLTGLVGSQLNGVWRLRIVDYWSIDDGFLDSWSISFPPACYNQLETETPILSGGQWTPVGSAPAVEIPQTVSDVPHVTTGVDPCPAGMTCTGNKLTNTATAGPFTAPGSYSYEFTVTDDAGCTHIRTVTVNVAASAAPQFDEFQTVYCLNETADTLPLPNNGVTGTWDPPEVDTEVDGTETYTFMTDCGPEYDVDITVQPEPDLSPILFN